MPNILKLSVSFVVWGTIYSSMLAQPFVGQISYSTHLDFHNDEREMQDYFLAKYGDSLIVSIDSLGRLRRDYIGTGAHGFEYYILHPESRTSYHKFHYTSILFEADAGRENTWITMIDTLAQEDVAGRVCDVFKIRILEPFDDDVLPWTYTLWLDQGLLLHSELYKDCHEGHWHAIAALNGGMYLKLELQGPLWTLTHTYTGVEVKQVDPALFEIDQFNVLSID